nr:uncharacterized protein LOC127315930 [Lolium perenne]
MVWLLDQEYDRDHRAFHMTERRTDLHPLKIRYHGTVDIAYDERYTEFIEPTGLLPFISLVSRGGPNMNAAALTALVDRWRPETHTFHLRAGEMTPTPQDVSMILGLPIQGEPLCMNTASDGWRQQMEALIGMTPPAPANPKERAPAGAAFSWIRVNFGECPEGANEDTRVYLWYMISRTLFPDSGGKLAHWCWLKALTMLEHRWSWGTAALAYLYRQVKICCMYYSSIVASTQPGITGGSGTPAKRTQAMDSDDRGQFNGLDDVNFAIGLCNFMKKEQPPEAKLQLQIRLSMLQLQLHLAMLKLQHNLAKLQLQHQLAKASDARQKLPSMRGQGQMHYTNTRLYGSFTTSNGQGQKHEQHN